MKKKALITGIAGQDGSYLAELLLSKGYDVHGIVRSVALEDPDHRLWRLKSIRDQIQLHWGSIESYASVSKIARTVMPDELYHLAAVSYISHSFEDELMTISTNINGTHNVLCALRELRSCCRCYNAASSEIFGRATLTPQNETTIFHPSTPYGISKTAGFYLAQSFRENFDLHVSSGILYNHESPRRGYEFVTRKITRAAARIKLGKQTKLELGNLEASRDWGHAQDYVLAMWMMLQQVQPDDYVIATGRSHRVIDFVETAFNILNMNWSDYVVIKEHLKRPFDHCVLVGDASKATQKLGWTPTISFEDLVEQMVIQDLMNEKGHEVHNV